MAFVSNLQKYKLILLVNFGACQMIPAFKYMLIKDCTITFSQLAKRGKWHIVTQHLFKKSWRRLLHMQWEQREGLGARKETSSRPTSILNTLLNKLEDLNK